MLDRQGDDDDCSVLESEEALEEDEGEKFVINGETNRSGYYVCRHPYEIQAFFIFILLIVNRMPHIYYCRDPYGQIRYKATTKRPQNP